MILGRASRILLSWIFLLCVGQGALAQQDDLDWGELSDEMDRLHTLTDDQLEAASNQVHHELEAIQDRIFQFKAFGDLAVGVFGGVLLAKGIQNQVRVGMVAGCGLMAAAVVLYVFNRRQYLQDIEQLHEQAQRFGQEEPFLWQELEKQLKKILDYLDQAPIYLEIPITYHPEGGFQLRSTGVPELPLLRYDSPTYVYRSYQYAGREWVKKHVAIPKEHLAVFRSLLFLKLLEAVSGDDFSQSCAKSYYDGQLTDSTVVQDLVKQAVNQSIRLDRVLLIGLSVLSEFESLDLKFAPDIFPEDARWINYRLSVSDVLKTIDASGPGCPLPILISLSVQ